MLQAVVLDPKVLIFDEIDTGVDVDALKTIAKFLDQYKKNRTIILITHYNRILKYIKPNKVLVLSEGRIVKEGNYKLAEEVERNGFGKKIKPLEEVYIFSAPCRGYWLDYVLTATCAGSTRSKDIGNLVSCIW